MPKDLEIQFICELAQLTEAQVAELTSLLAAYSSVLKEFLAEQGVSAQGVELSVELCDAQRMQYLNRTYRGLDKNTDVLSFPVFEPPELFAQKYEFIELGDIIINWEKTHSQAREFSLAPIDEFLHLLVHGFLHLCGWDHEQSASEAQEMEGHERKLIERFARKKIWNKNLL